MQLLLFQPFPDNHDTCTFRYAHLTDCYLIIMSLIFICGETSRPLRISSHISFTHFSIIIITFNPLTYFCQPASIWGYNKSFQCSTISPCFITITQLERWHVQFLSATPPVFPVARDRWSSFSVKGHIHNYQQGYHKP